MRPRIFVTQPIADSALARLRDVAEVEVNADASRIISKDALIAGVRRTDILMSLLHDSVDRDVIPANPDLRMIASMSITPDNTDVAAATACHIPVTVVPALSPNRRLISPLPAARSGAPRCRGRPAPAGGSLSRISIVLFARRRRLRQDAWSCRRQGSHRPGSGAPRARVRYARAVLGAAPQARGRGEAAHDLRAARRLAAPSRILFRCIPP